MPKLMALDNASLHRPLTIKIKSWLYLSCWGRTDSPGGEGDGESIFWKTREIGLPSYSKICTLWLQGKMCKNKLVTAASGMIFQKHRRPPVNIFSVKITALGSLKRVTERVFKIS